MLGLYLGLYVGGWLGTPVTSTTTGPSYLGYSIGSYAGGWFGLVPSGGPAPFPTQYPGLRVFVPGGGTGDGYIGKYLGGGDAWYGAHLVGGGGGTVITLCLVAEADAPSGMGGVIKINKNGTLYSVYLVETTDPNASPVRVQTSTGTKSIRLKT